MAYNLAQTAVWRPVDPEASVVASYSVLPFPEQWRDAMLDLCNAGRPPSADPYRTVPTYRIEQVLQAVAPDLTVMPRPRGNTDDDGAFWLCVPAEQPHPLPPAPFQALLNAWLRDLRPEPEHRALLNRVRALITADMPQWRMADVELLRGGVTVGGTAAPDARQFPLSTDWLARRIADLEPYDYGAGHLRFRLLPRGPRDKGAELVSQPLPFEKNGVEWWYSVRLNVTLHTAPFDSLPRFHLHMGLRRWATRTNPKTGRIHLPFGRHTTVQLRPRVPWLPGVPLSDRFALARLGWDPASKAIGWASGGPAGILRGISLAQPFPDADAIRADPTGWLTDDMRAAVVYSTAMGKHGVGAGLMSDQRSHITMWAEQALPAELRPAAPLTRQRRSAHRPANARPSSIPGTDKPDHEARVALARRTGVAFAMRQLTSVAADEVPVLEARLLWQTPSMRDTAIAALATMLGLKSAEGSVDAAAFAHSGPGAPVVLEWQSPELTVRLRCLRLTGGLAGDLTIPDGVRRTGKVVTMAVAARSRDAEAFVRADAPGPTPTLALVEIDRRDDFTTPDHDPKFALRLGCAYAGVLTQFVAVPTKTRGYDTEKNKSFRAEMAWDDGLRQLGVRVQPEHAMVEGLPTGARYAAVWIVRRNRKNRTRWAGHFPVAILVTPEATGSGLARVEGWDAEADFGAGAWIPYPAMLLKLARRAEVPVALPGPRDGEEMDAPEPNNTKRKSWHKDMEQQRHETEDWLQRVLRSLRGAPTVLLAQAQNARSHWTWLQDSRIEPDRIRCGPAPSRPIDRDLRLVRVRTARGMETAQWWGVHPTDEPNGLPENLWRVADSGLHGCRVFASTTPKPVQFRTSSIEANKLTTRPLRRGPRAGQPTVDTDKPAWNPGLVEIAVLGCHEDQGDEPEALALAVHHLRQPPDYPQALSLPLPLHLAGLGQEYVLPTRADEAGEAADARELPDGARDTDPDAAPAPGVENEPDPEEEAAVEQLAFDYESYKIAGERADTAAEGATGSA
ncbi:pPIWI_RE module domain-containing protein [Yinghuangia sp. YIM S09857]|uniref:pPIWI_RE module domain-containing protein n=1 Tax=Yinghuangia sp. YIM S09857 TaxID=3436929 RepID=UPI003F531A0C